ncbi:MAG: hypoxanthine-DNA glycosylase [Arenicella sp.]|jgi:TDG/mug DNA glycosylase family protein
MAAFEPILAGAPRLLILGSMPSQISLRENQYYANPRNAFWWIMSQLFEFDLDMGYRDRIFALESVGVAVWDVLYDCERKGSLDSAIVTNSEQPNDFELLFARYPTISKVIFNGAAAEKIFARHNAKLIQVTKQQRPDLGWHRCPSTSPAHASISKHDKLQAWRLCLL